MRTTCPYCKQEVGVKPDWNDWQRARTRTPPRWKLSRHAAVPRRRDGGARPLCRLGSGLVVPAPTEKEPAA